MSGLTDKEFEEKWNKAVKIAQDRVSKDPSLKTLTKRYEDYVKRF